MEPIALQYKMQHTEILIESTAKKDEQETYTWSISCYWVQIVFFLSMLQLMRLNVINCDGFNHTRLLLIIHLLAIKFICNWALDFINKCTPMIFQASNWWKAYTRFDLMRLAVIFITSHWSMANTKQTDFIYWLKIAPSR